MKELLKNKIMIGLLVFVIGVTYINTIELKKYENNVFKKLFIWYNIIE